MLDHIKFRKTMAQVVCGLLASFAVCPSEANAQFFSYTQSGEVLVGFRKTGTFQGNYEVVVNFGNVTNFLAMGMGSTKSLPDTSAALANAFPDGLAHLQWSAFAAFSGVTPWASSLGSFPGATIWYSLPRSDPNTQSTPQARFNSTAQFNIKPYILGIGANAQLISESLGSTNLNNNSLLVREPILGNTDRDLTSGIGDPLNPQIGDFGGTLPVAVENTTPATFGSASRVDLYQSVPASITGRNPVTYVDPITKQTNGPAYLVGYFQLNPNGTMSFTRATTNSVSIPPPPPQLSLARIGTMTSISFGTTNGATYTLHFTNSTGLSSPVANWPSLPSTVLGDGSVKTLTDNSTDADRVYRVGAH